MFRILRGELLLQQRQCTKHVHRTAVVAAVGTIAANPHPTSDFLRNSCGLSSEVAVAIAENFRLKSSANALSVIALLKDYGFSGPQIVSLVSVRPRILAANPLKTLKPKLDFYRGVGVPEAELSRFLLMDSRLLFRSVENRLKLNVKALSSVLQDDEKVAKAIRRFPRMLVLNLHAVLPPRVEALRRHGVTQAVISRVFDLFPKALVDPTRSFEEIFEAIKKIDIEPSSKMFSHTFTVFSVLPKPKWDRNMENYKCLGWSEQQVLEAFVKHPYCMSSSAEAIKKKMEFFARALKWEPDYVASRPVVLSFNFEKRILRRCVILTVLASKGLEKGGVRATHLRMSDHYFRQRYVTKHQNSVPDLAGIMDGSSKLELDDSVKKCLDACWIQYLQNA